MKIEKCFIYPKASLNHLFKQIIRPGNNALNQLIHVLSSYPSLFFLSFCVSSVNT